MKVKRTMNENYLSLNIKYRKPTDINELRNIEELEKNLYGKTVYVEEKIDGSISDNFPSSCAELNNFILCYFGEDMDVKNFHLLKYTYLPSKKIIFDVATIPKQKNNVNQIMYLHPEYSTLITFLSGLMFIPILYKGVFKSLKDLTIKFLSKHSKLKNQLQSEIIEGLQSSYDKIYFDSILKKPKNLREGIVIKYYSSGILQSYKLVNEWFEKLLKKFPREYIKQRTEHKNISKPYSFDEYVNYWNKNVFKFFPFQIHEKIFEESYYNYLSCYNILKIENCLENIGNNSKNKIEKLVTNFLQKTNNT